MMGGNYSRDEPTTVLGVQWKMPVGLGKKQQQSGPLDWNIERWFSTLSSQGTYFDYLESMF